MCHPYFELDVYQMQYYIIGKSIYVIGFTLLQTIALETTPRKRMLENAKQITQLKELNELLYQNS